MERPFHVFAGETPKGGWFDHQDSFASLRDAQDYVTTKYGTMGWDWHHIVHVEDGSIYHVEIFLQITAPAQGER
jgi:hypothetical protein